MCTENDLLKSRVTSLVLETQAQAREIWELKHEMSELKAMMSATYRPPRNDTVHGQPEEAIRSAEASRHASPTAPVAAHDVTTHTAHQTQDTPGELNRGQAPVVSDSASRGAAERPFSSEITNTSHHSRSQSSTDSDSGSESSHDDDDATYRMVTNRKTQYVENKKSNAHHLVFGDSTTKYIAGDRYMNQAPSFIQRTSTTAVAQDVTRGWKPSEAVQSAILHVGVNDVRDGTDRETIVSNIHKCLENMSTAFSNAEIGFSEILLVGRDDHHSSMNKTVKAVNERIKDYCESKGYAYVSHEKLQSPEAGTLFDDEVHINRAGGTAVLVSNIKWALRKRGLQTTNADQGRVFYNRKRRQQAGRTFPKSARGTTNDIDMNNIIKLLTINMLKSFGTSTWDGLCRGEITPLWTHWCIVSSCCQSLNTCTIYQPISVVVSLPRVVPGFVVITPPGVTRGREAIAVTYCVFTIMWLLIVSNCVYQCDYYVALTMHHLTRIFVVVSKLSVKHHWIFSTEIWVS